MAEKAPWEENYSADESAPWEQDYGSKPHPVAKDRYSITESAARGFADMGSWGTASKIEGALGAVKDFATEPSLHGLKGLKEAYHVREGLANDRYKESAEEHPIATIAGGLPGAFLAPGSSLFAPAKAAQGASAVARAGNAALNVGKAAGMGATYGAGSSRYNPVTETEDFGKDVGVGAAGGVAGYGLAKAAPVIIRGGGKLGRALGNVAFGVPSEAAEHYMANSRAVKNAPGLEQTTREFLQHADNTAGDISQASGRSFDTLRNTGILSDHIGLTQPLTEAANTLQRGGAYGPEQKSAITFLNSLAQDVQADAATNNGFLPLDRGKNLVRVLDAKIQAVSSKPGADARVLQELRSARAVADNFLKSSSPEYAAEMEKLAADTQAYKGMADNFRTPNGAMSRMKTIMRGKAPLDAEKLSQYDQRFGTNFGQDLKNSYTKDAFTRETTNGSRKTLLGALLGGPVGAVAGFAADKMGGQFYQKILDGTLKVGKFTAPLANAAKRGERSFNATHALLLKTSPEYRDLIESQTQGANQ